MSNIRVLDFDDGFTSSTPPDSIGTSAENVSVTPSGNLASDNAQDAFEELQADIDTRATTAAMNAGDASTLADAEAYTDTKIAALISAAPTALDTLDELSAALGDDPNFATTVSTSLGNRLRVDTAAQGLNSTQKTNVKTNIDLQNVDNTSDANKPISTATQTALDAKASLTDLSNHEADTTGIHGIADTANLATKTGSETLTNKTLTTPVMDVVTMTGQGSSPSNPSAGSYKFFIKTTDGKGYIRDSSGTETQIGSGSGSGGVNFITNGTFETDASGVSTYADAAGTSPVDGTGGSPSVTVARSTSSPLTSTASLVISKPASNCQGHGTSIDFTIDAASKAKVLQISFDSIISSGTFTAGSSTSDSDITIWIYDVTNSTLIQPSTYKVFSNSSSIANRFMANFQTSATSTSYRLIFHCATTSASAFDFKVDSITVAPTTYALGTIITDWVSYTPTTQGLGSVSSVQFYSRRVGSNQEIQGKLTLGTTTASEARIGLNNVTSADTTLIPAIRKVGDVGFTGLSTGNINALVEPSVTYLTIGYSDASNAGLTKTNGSTFSSSQTWSVVASVPVQGWSSQTIQSDVSDQRVVAAKYEITSGTATTAGNAINASTKVFDTHNAVSSGRFTCPLPGYYRVSVVSYPGAQLLELSVFKDAAADSYLAYNEVSGGVCVGSTLVSANAGQILDVRPKTSYTEGTKTAGTGISSICFERVANPAILSATETILATVTSTAAISTTVTGTVIFTTSLDDTHSAYNTSTGIYTCPSAGRYRVTLSGLINNGAVINLSVYQNNSFYNKIAGNNNNNMITSGACVVKCSAGDTLKIVSDSTGGLAYSAGSYRPMVTFERIGI